MAKYTDAIRNVILAAFNAGDQPTEAQFANFITRVQEGIDEHDHTGVANGDGIAAIGITSITGVGVDVPDDWYIGIGAALERIVFDAAGDISVMDAALGVGVLDPDGEMELHSAGYTEFFIDSDFGGDTDVFSAIKFQARDDVGADVLYTAIVNVILESAAGNEAGEMRFYAMQDGISTKIMVVGDVAGQLEIVQDVAGGANAVPVLVLQQDDISEGFINFIGSDRGIITGATDSLESVRVEINGVVRRIACYADG